MDVFVHKRHYLLYFSVLGIQAEGIELSSVSCLKAFVVLARGFAYQIGNGYVCTISILYTLCKDVPPLSSIVPLAYGRGARGEARG